MRLFIKCHEVENMDYKEGAEAGAPAVPESSKGAKAISKQPVKKGAKGSKLSQVSNDDTRGRTATKAN